MIGELFTAGNTFSIEWNCPGDVSHSRVSAAHDVYGAPHASNVDDVGPILLPESAKLGHRRFAVWQGVLRPAAYRVHNGEALVSWGHGVH